SLPLFCTCPFHPSLILFYAPAPPELSTLSLHDALPICAQLQRSCPRLCRGPAIAGRRHAQGKGPRQRPFLLLPGWIGSANKGRRSEEHTSELQSLTNLVCRLLLEKKNIQTREPPHLIRG